MNADVINTCNIGAQHWGQSRKNKLLTKGGREGEWRKKACAAHPRGPELESSAAPHSHRFNKPFCGYG